MGIIIRQFLSKLQWLYITTQVNLCKNIWTFIKFDKKYDKKSVN